MFSPNILLLRSPSDAGNFLLFPLSASWSIKCKKNKQTSGANSAFWSSQRIIRSVWCLSGDHQHHEQIHIKLLMPPYEINRKWCVIWCTSWIEWVHFLSLGLNLSKVKEAPRFNAASLNKNVMTSQVWCWTFTIISPLINLLNCF